MTVTKQRDAPWIHACGEDDEFYAFHACGEDDEVFLPHLRRRWRLIPCHACGKDDEFFRSTPAARMTGLFRSLSATTTTRCSFHAFREHVNPLQQLRRS